MLSIDVNSVSITKRFSISENGKVVSRVYIRDKEDDKHVYLFRIKTNKSHRRKGLATAIINLVIEKYKHRGITLRAGGQKESLSTTALIKIYRKFGFIRKGKTNTMYIDPPTKMKVGDKTKLHCPNCNSLMRAARLSYWFESVGAYDAVTSSMQHTDDGRKCHKCGLEFVAGYDLKFKGFIINRWSNIEDLKSWLNDVNDGKGENRKVRCRG
jgi:hypothetical protein